VVSLRDDSSGSLTRLSVHPASPVLLTKNGPIEEIDIPKISEFNPLFSSDVFKV